MCDRVIETLASNVLSETARTKPGLFVVFGPFDMAEAQAQQQRHNEECGHTHTILKMERG